MPTSPPDSDALLNENWGFLLKGLTIYADKRLKKFHWRGAHDGVLPDGHDAGSIAADTISDLLAGGYSWRQRDGSYTQEELRRELMRRASQQIKNLWIRAENTTTESYDGPDATGIPNGNGHYPGTELHPDQLAERHEAQIRLAEFRQDLADFLAGEPLLASLAECAFEAELSREEIARLLRISPKQVTNARKRLERRLTEYAHLHPEYPSILIQELLHA